MKTAGIIGGFGPTTTSEFFLKVVSGVMDQEGIATRPEILIWNAPVDEKLESDFISMNQNHTHFRNLLVKGAMRLKQAGSDFLVLPCNSLHIFIEDVKTIGLPTIDIIEETKKFINQSSSEQIGLLATSATINNKLFSSLNSIIPLTKEQRDLDRVIFNLITNKSSIPDQACLNQIISTLKSRGAVHIILGCTDLQQLITPNQIDLIDTLEILKWATIKEIFN